MITIPYKLNWMTDEDYEKIRFHWGWICDHDIKWTDHDDYEAWCKRVLN